MNYKQVLTFSFSDDEVRNDFKRFLERRRLVEMLDQSTYALPHKFLTVTVKDKDILQWSNPWIRENKIQREDFVQIFNSVKKEGTNEPSIQLITLIYSGRIWQCQ